MVVKPRSPVVYIPLLLQSALIHGQSGDGERKRTRCPPLLPMQWLAKRKAVRAFETNHGAQVNDPEGEGGGKW